MGDTSWQPTERFWEWLEAALADAGARLDGSAASLLRRLPAEASTRSFFRLPLAREGGDGASGRPATLVAMHSPPQSENNVAFVGLAQLFGDHGLAVPKIHAADLRHGFLLLEDLGECDFAAAYGSGVDAPLAAAIDALLLLQTVPAQAVPPYTTARFAEELGIFAEWLVRRLLRLPVPRFFEATAAALVRATQTVPSRVVHRDYHCRNLIYRGGSGAGAVGIVDFQDALAGPACYDLASLLRDCYHAFDEDAVARWRRRFFERAGLDCDAAVFDRAFDLTAVQRQLKAVGIFARLQLRDSRASHLSDIVPVLGRIERLGRAYSETRELADWVAAELLPAARRALS